LTLGLLTPSLLSFAGRFGFDGAFLGITDEPAQPISNLAGTEERCVAWRETKGRAVQEESSSTAAVVAPVSAGHLQKGKSDGRNDHIQSSRGRPQAAFYLGAEESPSSCRRGSGCFNFLDCSRAWAQREHAVSMEASHGERRREGSGVRRRRRPCEQVERG